MEGDNRNPFLQQDMDLAKELQRNEEGSASVGGLSFGVVKNIGSRKICFVNNLRDLRDRSDKRLRRDGADEGNQSLEQQLRELIPYSYTEDDDESDMEFDIDCDELFGPTRVTVPVGSGKVLEKWLKSGGRRVVPFYLSAGAHPLAVQFAMHAFDGRLPHIEHLVRIGRLTLDKFDIRSLTPGWPVQAMGVEAGGKESSKNAWDVKVHDMQFVLAAECEIIAVPLMDYFSNHCFLVVIKVRESRAEIWDSYMSDSVNVMRVEEVNSMVVVDDERFWIGFELFNLWWNKLEQRVNVEMGNHYHNCYYQFKSDRGCEPGIVKVGGSGRRKEAGV